MKQLLRLMTGLLPFFLFSCEYNLSGSHFEEVSPTTTVEGGIYLHEQGDTIYVQGDKQLYFTISLPGRELYGYQLKFNNSVVKQGRDISSDYFLQTKNYRDGYYKLQLSAITNSASGSLADKKGVEGLEVYRTWIVHIDNSLPSPARIVSIAPEDGQLRITWEPTTHKGFAFYMLIRTIGSSEEVIARSSDRNLTSFLDQSYIGGNSFYHVITYTRTSSQHTVGLKEDYNYPLPKILSATYDKDYNLTITHTSTPFYRNFRQYALTSFSSIIHKTTEVADTVVTYGELAFGGNGYPVSLYTYPKGINDLQYLSPSTFTVPAFGTPWGPFPIEGLQRRPAINHFYTIEDGRIKVIDASTLQVKQVRDINNQQIWQEHLQKNVISENAQHMYTILDDVIHKLDPTSLQTLEMSPLRSLLPFSDYENISLSVSNTNRLLIEANSYSTGRDTVYLVDMNRKKVVTKRMAGFFPNFSSISPDGKTIKVDESLFIEQSNGSWKQQTQLTVDVNKLVYHPTKPLFSVQSGRQLLFYSTLTGAWVKTITIEEEELVDYYIDGASGYLCVNGLGTLFIYNFDTGQLIRKLRVAGPAFIYKDKIFSQFSYIPL
ncbi:hypothetical protein K3G39_06335 [Pontibacter sp. HSC-14F20]|uniref:hypothetical protein n=1 Tax=Pontibacter sp. HSC-14F20 TaxID=2864136 RepID=UPI001C73534C|nr:hypothetical protein [Pontibacter sp. HSC-14F20]MBX0332849.1 hypothetical protein [Pontibacter sp. HSC-14F20]